MRKAISWIVSASLIGTLFFINNPQANAKVSIDVMQATGPVQFRLNLTKAIPHISANIPYDSGYKGKDTYVVVIDSGVQSDHPFLAGKVALEACFAPACPNGTSKQIGTGAAKPVHWHGTHVAGIIAGSNANMHGVAPEAKIIAINILIFMVQHTIVTLLMHLLGLIQYLLNIILRQLICLWVLLKYLKLHAIIIFQHLHLLSLHLNQKILPLLLLQGTVMHTA